MYSQGAQARLAEINNGLYVSEIAYHIQVPKVHRKPEPRVIKHVFVLYDKTIFNVAGYGTINSISSLKLRAFNFCC